MKKYAEGEGKLDILRGREAHVLNEHFDKTGKRKVSDFSEDEISDLEEALTQARDQEKTESDTALD